MNTLDAEDAVLDFDAFQKRQDPETQGNFNAALKASPDPSAMKKRLGSMIAVSATSGVALPDVFASWDKVARSGAAERLGWNDEAKSDDTAFHAKLSGQMQQQRDERFLVQGPDDQSKVADAESLSDAMLKGVIQGKSSAEVYGAWEPGVRGKPGYSADRLDALVNAGQGMYQQFYAKLAPVLPLAEESFAAIKSGKDLETASEQLYPQISKLTDEQRRGYLAAVRVMADALPEEQRPTFWGNMAKVAGRSGAGLGRGLMDFASLLGAGSALAESPENIGFDKQSELNKTALGEHNLESDLRRVQDTNYSPVKDVRGGGMLEHGLYQIPGALEFTAMAAVPVIGLPATYATLSSQAYDEQRFRLTDAGMSDGDASVRALKLAPIIAVPETALQLIGAKGVTGQFQWLNRTMLAIGDKAGGGVTGFLVRATGHELFGVANMKAQELMPPIVDAMASALDKDMPEVTWRNGRDGVFDGYWSKTGETFIAMLPLALLGAGGSGMKRAEAISKASDTALHAFGFRPEDVTAFRAATKKGPASTASAVETLIKNRDANSDSAKAATVELSKQAREQATAAVGAQGVTMRDADVRSVSRDERGWAVTKTDGSEIRVNSADAAQSIVRDLAQARSQKEAEALVSVIDNWHAKAGDAERKTTLTGNRMTVGEGGVMRDGDVVKDFNAEHFAELQREMEMHPELKGAVFSIDGQNRVSLGEKTAAGAHRLTQLLELHQSSDSSVLTFLHESTEADLQARLKTGDITHEEIGHALASIAEHFDPEQARTPEERAFRERVQRVARGEGDATETRETMTELAVADALGRRKDGSAFPAGSVTAGLTQSLMNAAAPREAQAGGKVLGFLRAAKQYFRAMFGTISALKKARREGKAADFDALIHKITGTTEQAAHEREVARDRDTILQEAAPRIELPPIPAFRGHPHDIAYSLKLEDYSRIADARWQAREKTPEVEPEKFERDDIRKAYEQAVASGDGFPAVPIADVLELAGFDLKDMDRGRGIIMRMMKDGEITSLGSGDWSIASPRERAWSVVTAKGVEGPHRGLTMRMPGAEKIIAQMYGETGFRLTTGNRLELLQKRVDEQLAKDPERRREVAKLAAEKLRKLQFNWENERFTARGDKIEPVAEKRTAKELDKEQAAQQAFHADELIKSGMDEKAARNQAREAAFEWRRKEDEKQARDWSPRAALARDLRTLDAILSVLPPELRAKVGGFVKLATLATEKARLDEIGRRIDKISTLLETHLQKENVAALDALIEKAAPKGGPGEKAGGKITVEGHRIFAQVEAVRGLSEERVQEMLKTLGDREATEMTKATPDREALLDILRDRQILLSFGDFEGKNAKDGDAAVRWLEKVHNEGRDAWREIKAQEMEKRAEYRATAIKEAGGPAATLARQQSKQRDANAGQGGRVIDFVGRKHQGWWQRLGSIFGTKSKTAEHFEDATQKAFEAKGKRLIERRLAQRDMLLRTFGAKTWWRVQDKLLRLQQRQEKSGVMKIEGRVRETLKLPVDKAQDILDGKAEAETFGLTKGDLPALQAAMDEWAADPGTRKENVSLDVTKNAGKGVEQLLSQLEAMHLTMLARQPQYREAMDAHGWTEDSLRQMEGFLSPEAKQIRQWLFDQYENEYAGMNEVYQRMYGIDLPKVDFYAPGYFEHAGEVTDMDPTGSGMDLAGMQSGFLRQRKNHKAEPVIVDALQTYWNHAMMTEHWKAFAPVVQELRSVFGAVDVRHAITAHEGAKAHEDVMSYVEKFEQNGVRDAASNRWIGRLTTALTRSGLSFNIGTWMKHLPNAFASLSEVPTLDFARGLARVMTGQAEVSLGEIWKSDAIRNRLLNSFTPDLRQIAQGASAPGKWLALTRQMMRVGDVLDWGVARIPWVAGAFTTFSAAVAHEYHFKQATEAGLSHDAALRYAEEKTAQTIARTAQPETIDRKSLAELERTGAARLMMLFHTPERQQWGVAFSAIADAIQSKGSKSDAARKLVSTWIVGPVLMQTMVGLWRYGITDEDAEEAWNWKRYAGAIALGPLSGVFGAGQILESFVHHATGAHGSKAGGIFDDMATRLIHAGKHLGNGEATFRDVMEFFGAAGLLTGGLTDIPGEALSTLNRLYGAARGLTTSKEDLHDQKHHKR